MSGDKQEQASRTTPESPPKAPGSSGTGRDAGTPRPRHPFVPGPVISEPDEVVKIWTPLPPEKGK